jgi:hypothetical protein
MVAMMLKNSELLVTIDLIGACAAKDHIALIKWMHKNMWPESEFTEIAIVALCFLSERKDGPIESIFSEGSDRSES